MQTLLTSPRPGPYDGLRADPPLLDADGGACLRLRHRGLRSAFLLSVPQRDPVAVPLRAALARPRSNAIYLALSDFFPGQVGDFIRYNVTVIVRDRGLQTGLPGAPAVCRQRRLRAARSGPEPGLGRDQEPALLAQSAHQPGADLRSAAPWRMLSMMFTALNYSIWPHVLGEHSPLVETLGAGLLQDGGHPAVDADAVPGLLAAAEPQDSARPGGRPPPSWWAWRWKR